MFWTVKNLDKTIKDLDKLATKHLKKVARKSQRENLKPAQKTAKSLAPKDTGHLKMKMIKIRAGKRSRVKVHTYLRVRWGQEITTPYAAVQEWGSPTVAPKAYIRKSYDKHENTMRANVKRDIVKGIEDWWNQ